MSLLALLLPVAGSAVELRDAELVAGGASVFQNGAGTVRLADGRLGRVGPTFVVPEPGSLWQLVSSAALLTLIAGRRRTRSPRGSASQEIR